MTGILNAAEKEEININVILSPAWLNSSPNCCLDIYNEYKNRNNIKGWLVKDEPQYWEWGDVFAGGEHIWNQLTMGYGLLSSLDCDRLVMFNLCALDYEKNDEGKWDVNLGEGTKQQRKNLMGSCENYAEYLDVMQKLFDPKIWSYDVYPISYLNSNYAKVLAPATSYNTKIEYKRFYKYLSIFSRKAKDTKHPFWSFGMTAAHVWHDENGNVTSGFPAPAEGMLKFEILSALAYGAQGIVYYQFSKSESIKTNGQIISHYEYGDAPLTWNQDESNDADKGFVKTQVFEVVKKVNTLVKFWKTYFLGCKVLTCVHAKRSFTGTSPVTHLACIKNISISGKESVEKQRDGVLLSWFQNSVVLSETTEPITRNYIAIVNHDPFNPQKVTMHMDTAAGAQRILAPSQAIVPTTGKDMKLNNTTGYPIGPVLTDIVFTLEPGGMEMIYWDNEVDYDIPGYSD